MQYFLILELLQDAEDPPLTRESIARLAESLAVTFPQEYVEFLLEHNGGTFHRRVILYVPDCEQLPTGATINAILGEPGEDIGAGLNISFCARVYEDRIPAEYLMVASSNGRDGILLGVQEGTPQFGKAWFWDGEGEGDGDNIYWLADSFNECLSLLLYDNCDPYVEEQETIPIFLAIERGRIAEVEPYLAAGNDVNAHNAKGLTLLAAAAYYSWPKIVRLLIGHSAEVNTRDRRGKTPLHHAACHSFDSVKLLVAAGAEVQARDRQGKGVLCGWSYEVDEYLRARGATE